MSGGSFEELNRDPAVTQARRARSATWLKPEESSDFTRRIPDRGSEVADINSGIGDGGMLADFDKDFLKGDLSTSDNPEHHTSDPSVRQLPVRTDPQGREEEYQKLKAAHEQERVATHYKHGGTRMNDETGNDWENFLWNRIDPEKILPDKFRARKANDVWEDYQGDSATPDAGWDKPKVGKFRSAMSWLGNKLTFGKYFGKNYKSRQEDLARRDRLTDNAFVNKMLYYEERQFGRDNPGAWDHQMSKNIYGDQYIGMSHNDSDKLAYDNPRFNSAPNWIADSSYGRTRWDELVNRRLGIKKSHLKYNNLLG
jgi:hypothetical protein